MYIQGWAAVLGILVFASLACAGDLRRQEEVAVKGSCPEDPGAEAPLTTNESLSRYGPSLSAARAGKRIQSREVEAVDSLLFRLMRSSLDVFLSADEPLRMIVTPEQVSRIQQDHHIAIAFLNRVPLQPRRARRPLCIQQIVIPLAGEKTEGGWTLFYRDAGAGDWFALRWTDPDRAVKERLTAQMDEALKAL